MAPTKVFYLITGLHIGGAEKAFLELTRCLDRTRFEPVIGTLVGGELIPEFERAGVPVYDLEMRHAFDLRAVIRLWRALRRERPAVLHTRLIHADWLGRVVGTICRVPVIVSTIPMVEDIRRRWFWKTIDRWTSRANTAIIALSDLVKRELIAVERLDARKFDVIPNGIVGDGWPDPAAGQAVRAQLGLGPETLLVGVVSRLETPRKGHHIFLDAFRQIAVRCPNAQAVIIGDGPGRATLEALAQAVGLASRVRFVGTQRDVRAWLSALDLFVLPSLNEGFPMAIVEAMAAARPIVATAVAGVPDLILERETGRVVPPGDAEALARAMAELLAQPALRAQYAHAARQRFDAQFDMRQVAGRIQALYDRLLAGSRPDPLKVLEVVTTLDAGGVTTYLAHLIEGLPRTQFACSLAAGSEGFEAAVADRLGVPCHRVALTKPIRPLQDLRALWQLCRIIRRERFDLVHTHMAKGDLLGGLAARLCGVPAIVSTAHGPLRVSPDRSLAQTVFDAIEWLVYRTLPTLVISVSASTTAELLRKGKVRPDRLLTIPNGFPISQHAANGYRARVRAEFGLDPSQPVITMVGRLKAPKMPGVLIEAMRELAARQPDAVCLIVGEGPERGPLAARIADLGLQRSVRLLGTRRDVPALLAAADLFVLPTYSEGMPYSVLEAMAAGLPVVTARLEPLAELIEEGKSGRLVSPHDAAAYAEAIDALLRDPECLRAMGLAAQEAVRTRFSLERQLADTAQALRARPLGRPVISLRPPSRVQRLRLYAREEGWGQAMRRLIGALINPWYRHEQLWFLSRPVAAPMPRVRGRSACTIRMATAEDAGRLAAMGFDAYDALVSRLHSAQDRCFIAEEGGRIVAFQWVALGPRSLWIEPLEQAIPLRDRQAHLVRCRALRSVRGQGVIPAIEREVLAWLAAQGWETLTTDISHDHALSLKTFEHLGFVRDQARAFRRWGPIVRRHAAEAR